MTVDAVGIKMIASGWQLKERRAAGETYEKKKLRGPDEMHTQFLPAGWNPPEIEANLLFFRARNQLGEVWRRNKKMGADFWRKKSRAEWLRYWTVGRKEIKFDCKFPRIL